MLDALTKFYTEAKIHSCAFGCTKLCCCEQQAEEAIGKEKKDWEQRASDVRKEEGPWLEHWEEAPKGLKKKKIALLRHGQFTEASSAYVGTGYECERSCCRLLFLSLDPGSDDSSDDTAGAPLPTEFPGFRRGPDTACQRTPEAIRVRVVENLKKDVGSDSPRFRTWIHWYGTHLLAAHILREAALGPARELCEKVCCGLHDCKAASRDALRDLAKVVDYFAHANVVKCSVGKLQNARAPGQMYENCQRYLKGELPLLKPDIIVSQGNGAADALDALKDHFSSRPFDGFNHRLQYLNLPEMGDILWMRTYHPRYGRFWTEGKAQGGACWGEYAAAAANFMAGKRRRCGTNAG